MKNIVALALISCLFLTTQKIAGQKLDRESIGKYSYVQLPINPVLIHYNAYRVEGSGQYSDAYRRDAIISKTSIDGFVKVAEGADCDFVVKVEEYPLQYGEIERQTKVEKYKKDGVEKSRTLYFYTQDITCRYVMRIYNNEGEKIYEKSNGGVEKIVGPSSSSTADAKKGFSTKKSHYVKNVLSQEVGELCSIVNDQIAYPVKSLYIRTATVKAKKYKYDDYFQAYELFKKGFEIVKNNEEAVKEASVHFNKSIQAFEKLYEEVDLDNKKARINKKVATAIRLNIALSYLMMKDYDKAIVEFTKGREIDKNFGSMSIGLTVANKRKKRVEANIAASQEP